NWLIGREIVEEEQKGRRRTRYGQKVIIELSRNLQAEYGTGYSTTNLKLCRQFYLQFPNLIRPRIGHTPRDQFLLPQKAGQPSAISHTPCNQSWRSGRLHSGLAWSLYRHLLRVEKPAARSFYEIEAVENNWSARELERQINS